MKKLLMILAAAAMVGCGTQEKTTSATTPRMEQTRTHQPVPPAPPKTPKNMDVTVQKDASGNLSGIQNKSAFMDQPFSTWFTPRYDSYNPDAEIVNAIEENLDGVEIRAYMGTWCGDSKRETPKFYKLLDQANYDLDDLTMITVDRSKRKPEDLVSGYNIMRVPTFIFYKEGEEIGRYVERPRESLEKDILKIVSGQEYKHSYEN